MAHAMMAVKLHQQFSGKSGQHLYHKAAHNACLAFWESTSNCRLVSSALELRSRAISNHLEEAALSEKATYINVLLNQVSKIV